MAGRLTIAALSAACTLALAGCSFEFSVGTTSDETALPSDAAPAEARSSAPSEAGPDEVMCEYPDDVDRPEKIDPETLRGESPENRAVAEDFNERIDRLAREGRSADPPTGAQPATGESSLELVLDGDPVDLTLDRSGAPCTVAAVAAMAEQGYYDDSICHRLTTGRDLRVLQCGDPSGTGLGGPGFRIADELPTSLDGPPNSGYVVYPRGTVAMAKAQTPDSAGSQFFLVYGDSELPPEYAVLGTVDEAGLRVVDRIAAKGVKSEDPASPDGEVPTDEVRIEKASVG